MKKIYKKAHQLPTDEPMQCYQLGLLEGTCVPTDLYEYMEQRFGKVVTIE